VSRPDYKFLPHTGQQALLSALNSLMPVCFGLATTSGVTYIIPALFLLAEFFTTTAQHVWAKDNFTW
jgi:hypothetical protein